MVDVAKPGERIPLATDHAGYDMKEYLRGVLSEMGYQAEDMGTHGTASVDYPDFGHPLAKLVSNGTVQRGILLCGTGLGMSYVANRHAGVRAAVCWTPEIATLSRQHNDANVLVLPARFISNDEALAITKAWLETAFDAGRHIRRIEKIELSYGIGDQSPGR